MLTELTIRNLGAIPESTVELGDGLTVLTGETGAGKTMVVTGLRLLLGGRADASRVRIGADKALVEGRIAVDDAANADDVDNADNAGDVRDTLKAQLDELGGDIDENGEVLLARQVSAKGRSRAWVAGRSVPAAQLGEITSSLLQIHGQNDQLRLRDPEAQAHALDRYGNLLGLVAEYRQLRGNWLKLRRDFCQRTEKRRELALQADQLQRAIDEIVAVNPQPDEEEQLAEQIRRRQASEALQDAALTASSALDGSDENSGAVDQVGAALAAVRGLPDLEATAEQLQLINEQLSEISVYLGGFLAELADDEADVDQLMERQAAIKTLTRKYAPDIAGVLAWQAGAERKLASLDVSEEALAQLKQQVQDAQKKLSACAKKLTKARRSAATGFQKAVAEELRGLAMSADIAVEVTPLAGDAGKRAAADRDAAEQFGPSGSDVVRITLGGRDLTATASGGELSRIMLALEVVLAGTGETLVFDEVDAGVGGRAAVEIGRRLARLAQDNQVIVVTHLPQVAAYADAHLRIAKDGVDSSAVSGVSELSREQRIEELARMLAGLDDTDSGRAHAAELLERAESERKG